MIAISIEGSTAILSVAGLPRLTAHDVAFGRELCGAIRSFDDRDDIKVLLLTSPDADFCADGEHGASVPDSEWLSSFASAGGLYQTWCFSRKVTLAAVHGRCTSAGSLLALYADLTIASTDATFSSPFAALPEAGFVMTALTIGLNRAKSWIVSDDDLDADRARDIGLVNQTVPPAVLGDAARRLARDCCKMPLDGIAMSKLMMESYLDGQGVGEEFDHIPFYAAAMRAA